MEMKHTFNKSGNQDRFDAAESTLSRSNTGNSPGLITGFGGDAGFGESFLDRNDDLSTAQIDLSPVFESGLNFFGTVYSGFWINNNGSVTFSGPRGAYTPTVITGVSNNPEITPFFADVDTLGGAVEPTPGGNSQGTNLVYWHFDEINDRVIVTWDDVGYFRNRTDLLNAFQLILTDVGNGDFNMQFRYEDMNWTTGDFSGGTNGLGGTVARAGWTAGTGIDGQFFELPQSGDQEGILALDTSVGNSGLVGIWNFFVRSGGVVTSSVPLLPNGGLGAWVAGDPHLATLDGIGYSFQAAGEFVLLRGTNSDFELQARMVPVAENVTVNAAVATNLGGTAVMIDATDATPLSVAGVATTIDDFGSVTVGTDAIFREGNVYTIVYAGADGIVNDGDSQVRVAVWDGRVDIDVRLNDELLGALEGLLGDGDGNPDNDVALANGTVLDRPFAFEDLYGAFRSDWRVSSTEQSLFTYDAGESLAGFYLSGFPSALMTLDDLDPDLRDAATQAAINAGLTPGSANFNNAVLDFALTQDSSFLTSALNVPTSVTETVTTSNPAGSFILTGTDGADTLVGGALNDTIRGLGGDDVISGQAGDDNLEGGAGDDQIAGGDGNDVIFGGIGNDNIGGGLGDDLIHGDAGNDTIGGGQGNDTIYGGDGDDVLAGGVGNDEIYGGTGSDTIGGSLGADTIEGGAGADSLGGGTGRDVLYGGGGNDSIGGGEGDDTVYGGAGADFLAGGGRNDLIFGGAGDDIINGGAGDDTMTGGVGADLFVFNSIVDGEADVITDFEAGSDMIRLRGVAGQGIAGKFDALDITSVGGNAVIAYDGHTITLQGVAVASLDAGDFLFI